MRYLGCALLLLCVGLLPLGQASARVVEPFDPWQRNAKWRFRDLTEIRKSGELRVLINQSRNSSGKVRGQTIGVESLRVEAFVDFLNTGQPAAKQVRLRLIPLPKDELVKALQQHRGDFIAPGELLDLKRLPDELRPSRPYKIQVPLVLVSHYTTRRHQRLEQLAGKVVVLPRGSIAPAAVSSLNKHLAELQLEPVSVDWGDPSLAVEDVLELVHAGVLAHTWVELPIAERWAGVLKKLRIDPQLALPGSYNMVWVAPEVATGLQSQIDRFLRQYQAAPAQDQAFRQVYQRLYRVHYPLGRQDRGRIAKIKPALQKAAKETGVDWLALVAVAYKESSLNPAARGQGGATGLMQVTPVAAKAVGVSQYASLEGNALAGARYLARLKREFFASSRIPEHERLAFMLAAYNMGPHRLQGLRAQARQRGLNPDRWFFHVERIAMEQLGMGSVSYVSSVNKYYLTFDRERDSL
ncbi:transglycosylase SLT domain-containing protein [Atopomonas sediminilitoris]|uniref:transglycosylase SLT domain-containing protein n=1 Tax=Atopomonas sediminilitoris TaxID=2919919 RepID=UPI001F4E7410|nr:transglycosylase SLT domain-containing protein [Atopomonas sediminilitoris]MCJ8167812.1 transglycosylase SLT domain-containing protein [Atopomonas sediminilitoris]